MATNKHIGSTFDSFPVEQGMPDEVTAVAIKRVIAWQITEAMKRLGMTKVAMLRPVARKQALRSAVHK